MPNTSPDITNSELPSILKERFGLPSFRDGQRQIIERLLVGKSAAAIFPTGGGKSLCYQLPAVVFSKLTLVVSPLLALMREQVDELNRKGIPAARIDSTLDAEQLRATIQSVREGEFKLLYVAPERFFNERFREFIFSIPIALFAIDEAHCISQWGHNFRPDYLKLARIAKQLNAERVLALTATATPAVLDDIRSEFEIAPEDAIQTPFYRPNLKLKFTPTDSKRRFELLVDRLQQSKNQASLVYVTLQRTAEELTEQLNEEGFSTRAYHAGLDDAVREEVQDWFMNSPDGIVVATIAFGMGIDKSNIRAIYHYNPSKSIENLAQEIGRAGRDGETSVCETLLVTEDRAVLENFAHGDTPSKTAVGRFVEFIVGQPQQFHVSQYSLAAESDIRIAVVRTLLTQLELKEILSSTAPRYEKYKFKPLVPSTEILRHFEGEQRTFAASVLTMTVKKRVWFEISLPQVADRLKCERSRIVKMLDLFENKGWMELQVSGLVHGYKKLKPISDIAEWTSELHQYVVDREIGELARLNELFTLMASQKCKHGLLGEHFGQPLQEPCGTCSSCQGLSHDMLPPEYSQVGDSAITAVQRLARENPQILCDIPSQAKFLCGMSSPKMTRARLSRDPMFGCCELVPFDVVLEALST